MCRWHELYGIYMYIPWVKCLSLQTLLLLNAPLRPRTPEEDTPRDLAARYKQKEVMELLGR